MYHLDQQIGLHKHACCRIDNCCSMAATPRTFVCVLSNMDRERESVKKYDHNDWFRFIGMCKLAPDNTPVLVMERMEMNLGTHLTSEQNANLPLQRKLEILGDVIQGLHHMHTHTPVIIHRDLTAGNVLYRVNYQLSATLTLSDGCSDVTARVTVLTSKLGCSPMSQLCVARKSSLYFKTRGPGTRSKRRVRWSRGSDETTNRRT